MDDTIIAQSSAAGSGLRAIVRLSGENAFSVMAQLTEAKRPAKLPAVMETHLRAPLPQVACRMLAFEGPKSFTGQDCVELHLPGSPALVRMVMDAATAIANVRQAEAGEFSARAFFNGKMDLTEAEGIAAVISAANARQLRAATGLREGALHKRIEKIAESVADLLARTEAGIDFSDEEDVKFISSDEILQTLDFVDLALYDTMAMSMRVDRLDDAPTVVFIGEPNVGKSSIINALSGQSRSIVSPVAGTTRDMLTAIMPAPDGAIRLLDVPGEEKATDELRQKMMAARDAAILEADLILNIVVNTERVTVCSTKSAQYPVQCIDIQNKEDELNRAADRSAARPGQIVSAKTGEGIELLRQLIVANTRSVERPSEMAINQRHRQLLSDTRSHINNARFLAMDDLGGARISRPELIASEFRLALDLLGQITGTISPDEILGRIFSRFCIGK